MVDPAPPEAAHAVARGLAEQRRDALRWLAALRLAGALAFLGLVSHLGLLRALPDWRVYVAPMLAYTVATGGLLLLATRSSPRLPGLTAWAVPLVDVPAVGALQYASFPVSTSPSGTAGWSLGLFVLLVVFSALTLRTRVVQVTIVTAWIAEGFLQREAGVSLGAVLASGVVLALAAGVTTWAVRRLEALVERLVAEETARRLATERTLALEDANRTIARVNADLVATQREAEGLTSLLVHDLKAPLTTIQGTLELIRSRGEAHAEGAAITAGIDIAETASRRLLAMIGDLLGIARLERRAWVPALEPLDVPRFLAEAVGAFAAPAEAKGIALLVAPEAGLSVRADPFLLRRLVDNLVTNAMGVTGSGGRIEVAAHAIADEWVLMVRNEGRPVPAEVRAHLFEKFGSSRGYRGPHAGLGLYLCRLVAEAHGGRIALDDAPGFSACFAVRLPREGGPPVAGSRST